MAEQTLDTGSAQKEVGEMVETGIDGNCPTWPGASKVYSRIYRGLENMRDNGHVRRSLWYGKATCYTSQEMDDIITALNEGDEETLKGWVFWLIDHGYLTY